MPELPEVETMRRGILPAVNATIVSLYQPKSSYRPIQIQPSVEEIAGRVQGLTIRGIDRLGKRVVVQIDNDDLLVFQPKMAGLVIADAPPNEKHVRLVMELSDSPIGKILYWDQRGLGTIKLYTKGEMHDYLKSGTIGPDALQIDFPSFFQAFHPLNRPVKPALLDQSKVAGIGNLYASEILHQCKISPFTACHELTKNAWKRIYESMREILLLAIEYEGSTLSDGTYRNSKNNPGSYQNAHRVYGRAGQICMLCNKNTVERVVQSQRSTFYCRRCQK